MQINFLTFIPYQDDLISINKIDLSTDQSHTLTINLLSSYNGTDFRPATLELDTTANASSMTLNIDLFQVLIEPGTYFVRNISGASVVSIVSSEQVTINFYRSFKPERMIITNRNKADNVVSRSIYNSWGVNGNNLSAIYNAAAKEWRWNVTNLPPFNDGANISNAHLILNSDANRLFMIMQGSTPHSPEKTAQRNLFHLRRKTGRCLVLSVWIDVCVSVSLVIFDNSAQVLSSYFNGLKTRQPLQTQLLPIQENFDLRECQSPVNWDLVNMKYLVVLFFLLYCRHVYESST